jgi:hypothetical protein
MCGKFFQKEVEKSSVVSFQFLVTDFLMLEITHSIAPTRFSEHSIEQQSARSGLILWVREFGTVRAIGQLPTAML